MEPMRPGGPIITVNDYDKDDDTDCGCETCNTPWGDQALPLLMLAGRTQLPAPTPLPITDGGRPVAAAQQKTTRGAHLRVVPPADQ